MGDGPAFLFRLSGESRNPVVSLDPGFRRGDGNGPAARPCLSGKEGEAIVPAEPWPFRPSKKVVMGEGPAFLSSVIPAKAGIQWQV
jgi:hypothetical protein